MYFDDIKSIKSISSKTNCAIFVMPDDVAFEIPKALLLSPDDKSVITVEQVRGIIEKVLNKQLDDQFIIVRPAEKLSEVASNAFLKSLEEPNEKIHFVLVTKNPSMILSTILSRARVYFLRQKFDNNVEGDEKNKILAKKLIVAKPNELNAIADEIIKKKTGVRKEALEVVGLAIEMLYKSFFINEKQAFLKKIPKFLKLYENLQQNGHIKLHIVADLC